MVWDREECFAARMDGYATKSIETEELFAVIERLNEEGL
jgi:CheY-like chemotaxis protein